MKRQFGSYNDDQINVQDVMATNIDLYGILVIYIDSIPAMMTDFTATADELTAAVDENIMAMAGADPTGYNAALAAFRTAAEQHAAQIDAINAKGMSASKESKKLNEKSHAVFKAIQEGLIGVIASSDVVIKRVGYQENIAVLSQIVAMLAKTPLNEIKPTDVRQWQNELTGYRDENGQPYSATYLKTINNQLTAVFNYAVKYYGLKENPCHKAGSMGKKMQMKRSSGQRTSSCVNPGL